MPPCSLLAIKRTCYEFGSPPDSETTNVIKSASFKNWGWGMGTGERRTSGLMVSVSPEYRVLDLLFGKIILLIPMGKA